MPPQYPFPWKIGLLLLRDAFLLHQRDFQADNLEIVTLLNPQPHILGIEHSPTCGPALLVTNHYSRPGLSIGTPAKFVRCPARLHYQPASYARDCSTVANPTARGVWLK